MTSHIPSSFVNRGHTIQAAPPVSVLNALILPTYKELKEAHYRIAAETPKARESAGREFRMSQPAIYAYLSFASRTPRVLASENAMVLSFGRHFCAAIEPSFGKVPVLRAEDLEATANQAKALLAHGPSRRKVQTLPVVKFALGGILGVHYFDGIQIIPDRKRVLLKVLTLLLSFGAAIKDYQQQLATTAPVAGTSH